MSRTASDTSVLSDGRYVPWQYKWMRPMISRKKSVKQKYRHLNDMSNKVPISIASARLNAVEVDLIKRHIDDCTEKDKEQVHPDESTTGSDSQVKNRNIEPKDDVSYFVLVTTFASKSTVSFLQTMAKEDHNYKVIPAESILLEVVQDSFRSFDSGTIDDEWYHDEMDIISSNLLYWPSSIRDSSIFQDDGSQVYNRNFESSIWDKILRGLKLRKSSSEMREEDKQKYHHQRKLLQLKKIKSRTGITGITISRLTQQSSEQEVDMDEVFGLMDRLGLGFGIDVDPDLLIPNILSDYTDSRSCDEEEEKLVLSCLCNDGRVHVFSLVDLILSRSIEWKEEGGNRSTNHSFLNGFESFIFGNYIKASLDEHILPLTNPITTINLSVNNHGVKQVINQQASDDLEESNDLSKNKENEHFREVIIKVEQQIENYRPRVDFSSFDANIEFSTLPDQTVNNTPFLCSSAFEYVVIGGMGNPKISSTSLKRGRQSHRNRLKGGFVSFISTRYLSEARTVYLPFYPKIISPVIWKSVQLVIVIGQRIDQCVAIRVDSSSRLLHHNYSKDSTAECSAMNQHFTFLKKFCPVYISFYALNEIESSKTFPICISTASDDVPSIIICTIAKGDIVLQRFNFDDLLYKKQGSSALNQERRSTNAHITTRLEHRRFVRIPSSSCVELQFENGLGSNINVDRDSVVCISSDGWILVSLQLGEKNHLFFASFDGSMAIEGAHYREITALDYPENRFRHNFFNAEFLTPISATHDSHSLCPRVSTKLNDATHVKSSEFFYKQTAIATIKLTSDEEIMITMRKSAVSNGKSSSFDEIIKWLCSECDFVTAGRIALKLLDDNQGLLDLERTVLLSHGDDSDEAFREGILDGISGFRSSGGPRSSPLKSSTTTQSQVDRKRQRNMTKISNTVILCLVKGGSALSHTLEKFLGRNEFYDASSACRILVLSTKDVMKKFDATDVNLATNFLSRLDSHDALWPIRCLLRVASCRNFIERALEMLNETIPDLLRNRVHNEINSNDPDSQLSLKLSMSIISMILASTDDAASYLLNLVDTITNELYWCSLDDETRRSLSVLHVHGKYPLLREFEVRAWIIDLLQKATGLIPCDDPIYMDSFIKSEWLRDICTGVLCNAGCDLSHTILFTPALSTEGVKDMNLCENNMFRQMQEEEEDLYDYLDPAPNCGGIDFDLIISAFLILEKRQVHWLGNEKVPSQTVLNIVCDLAGRYNLEEPNYPFDAVSAMKQCVAIGNPEAAANLIGGQNGLFLKCAYILSKEFNMTMQEAEHFLTDNLTTIPSKSEVVESQTKFVMTDSHKSLLLLLEKHVMGIRKYGDLHCGDSRGRLDPIYAARICLKTWFLLTRLYPSSGPWLERWLIGRLRLQTSDFSLNRLPHAAIAHALLWDDELPNKEKATLAESLKFSPRFLIDLAQVPCGIMECSTFGNIPV